MNTSGKNKLISYLIDIHSKGYRLCITIYSLNDRIIGYFDFDSHESNPEWSKKYFIDWADEIQALVAEYVKLYNKSKVKKDPDDFSSFGLIINSRTRIYDEIFSSLEKAEEFIQDKAIIFFDAMDNEWRRCARYKLYNTTKENINDKI